MGKRANYLPPELEARYESLTGDSVDGLEETVRIQQAMETQLWSQLDTGESHQAWKLLNELVAQWEFADEGTQTGIFLRIKMIAEGGLKAYGVKKEILDLQERQRKQTETLTKCRKEIQETYTQESWNQMLGQVLRILKLRCDTETLRLIATDIQNEGLERGRTNGTPTREPVGALQAHKEDNGDKHDGDRPSTDSTAATGTSAANG